VFVGKIWINHVIYESESDRIKQKKKKNIMEPAVLGIWCEMAAGLPGRLFPVQIYILANHLLGLRSSKFAHMKRIRDEILEHGWSAWCDFIIDNRDYWKKKRKRQKRENVHSQSQACYCALV
jgi:hypothetical protein